ncbi:hypothetical protein [Bradyrhizobium stylosanthis]|uniref:Uncharacterized protein n=1 Tax=Bradyrhizobium stylosanthis TaxID=1803665 RepID=A0A560ECU1_9BRAD|nr:hypothetical protein [Bradyrhizobium stylosanthis]TWB07193.1 hypothetical protein FBZ96_1011011 [Bradyrhizobium stylosanthis]
MTIRNELDTLRTFAKNLSRKHQIRHHDSLDIIAMQYGHPHWVALMKAWDKGWRPAPWELVDINECSVTESPTRSVGSVRTSEGVIASEPYTLKIGFDDVLISGNGWAIYLDHAPSKPAIIETYTKPNPLDDKAFFSKVMKIAMEAADGVREAIAKDWGPASMQPDKDSSVKHPLFGGVSAEWFCMHCEACSTGAQMAANMWHCPKCSATPLDMHSTAWWKDAVIRADGGT